MATEGNSLELTSIPRIASANRFQVNPVTKAKNGDAVDSHDHDDDQFNEHETEVVKRRTSRIQSIKSSIRDSTKSLTKKERKESIARFEVSDDNSDSNEDENLLDGNEYDTKYGRSLRYGTSQFEKLYNQQNELYQKSKLKT